MVDVEKLFTNQRMKEFMDFLERIKAFLDYMDIFDIKLPQF